MSAVSYSSMSRSGYQRRWSDYARLPRSAVSESHDGGTAASQWAVAQRFPRNRLLEAGKAVISSQFECNCPELLPASDAMIGIDRGVKKLASIFDDREFQDVLASKHLRKTQKRLRRARRVLYLRKKGSARRRAQARRVGVIHRNERECCEDLLHQIVHRLTAKAGVIKVETLNVMGMARNRHLALLVADAGTSRLTSRLAYRAGWRGRRIIHADPWFPSSQTCSLCGALRREMRNLRMESLCCDWGNVMDRDHNAAANLHWYPEEWENRIGDGSKRVDEGDQELAPVPECEARISAYEKQ